MANCEQVPGVAGDVASPQLPIVPQETQQGVRKARFQMNRLGRRDRDRLMALLGTVDQVQKWLSVRGSRVDRALAELLRKYGSEIAEPLAEPNHDEIMLAREIIAGGRVA